MSDARLNEAQLQQLKSALHSGADDASTAMARWLGVPSLLVVDSLEQVPVESAVTLLGADMTTVCLCAMQMSGGLRGQLVFAFDDCSGLTLTDLLLKKDAGSTTDWDDVAQSAALETTNIIGCAYLNALSSDLSGRMPTMQELIPSPPVFRRDFAESLLQSVIMDQAVASDTVLMTRVRFELNHQPMQWTLLMVPDPESLDQLRSLLPHE